MKSKSVSDVIRDRSLCIIYALILPILILVVWQVGSDEGWINQSIFPGPSKVADTVLRLTEKGVLIKHISASFIRVIKGFLIGLLAGLLVGAITATFERVHKLLAALIGLLRPIPPIAVIPFFILWFGIGEESKVAVIVLGSFWPVLLNTIQGIKSADTKLLEVGKVFEKNKFQIFYKIVLPSAIPSIFTGIRLGISNAWTCVVAAEMIAASAGIGYLISYGRELAQPATLLTGVIIIGVIGLIIDLLVLQVQKYAVYWVDTK